MRSPLRVTVKNLKKSLCELGKTCNYFLRTILKNLIFESMDEFGEIMP